MTEALASGPAPLEGGTEVSTELLTRAIRAMDPLSNRTVRSWTSEPEEEGTSFTSEVRRLRIEYESDGSNGPASLVAKLPSTREQMRTVAGLFRLYEREVNFYGRIARDVPVRTPKGPVRTPKGYVSSFDPESGEFLLLLEDMAPSGRARDFPGSPRRNIVSCGYRRHRSAPYVLLSVKGVLLSVKGSRSFGVLPPPAPFSLKPGLVSASSECRRSSSTAAEAAPIRWATKHRPAISASPCRYSRADLMARALFLGLPSTGSTTKCSPETGGRLGGVAGWRLH